MAIVKSLKATGSDLAHNTVSIIGTLESISPDGTPMVSFPEDGATLWAAQSALSEYDFSLLATLPVKVVLLVDIKAPQHPVITGVVRDKLPTAHCMEQKINDVSSFIGQPDVLVDGQRVTLSAQHEILLQCGKSSILLRRDGKVVIKGSNLISRSSGTNKIKGSSININ